MDRIVQNYYGNNKGSSRGGRGGGGNQSQKHFCAVCRIEIAPSRTSVMFHESSKQHLDKMREAIERTKHKGGNGGSYANMAS